MIEQTGYRLNSPLVALQEIEGEAILINFDTGCYFSANRTGSVLLELAESGASQATMVRRLAERCGVDEVEVRDAVEAFLTAAQGEGLVVPCEVNGASAPPTDESSRIELAAPVLEKFDDLQDLLMLDPIHDVDQAGWPMQAPDPDARPQGTSD